MTPEWAGGLGAQEVESLSLDTRTAPWATGPGLRQREGDWASGPKERPRQEKNCFLRQNSTSFLGEPGSGAWRPAGSEALAHRAHAGLQGSASAATVPALGPSCNGTGRGEQKAGGLGWHWPEPSGWVPWRGVRAVPPHLLIQTGLPEASPSPARGRGVSVAGPWGPRAGDGEGDPGPEAFCPAGPELQCRLLRTESLARFQGGKNPSPKRRECCLIKAAAGRRENSPLKKKSLSLEK